MKLVWEVGDRYCVRDSFHNLVWGEIVSKDESGYYVLWEDECTTYESDIEPCDAYWMFHRVRESDEIVKTTSREVLDLL